jgi:integrase
VDFTVRGKRITRSTKTSNYKEAKKILGIIQGKIATDKFSLSEVAPIEIMLREFLEEKYFPYARSYKRPSTMDLEMRYCRKFLAFVGNVNLRSISVATIDQWKAQMVSTVSPTSWNIVLRSLKSVFNTAKKWEYIDKNPFDQVQRIRVDERRRYLMDSEVARIMEVIDQDIHAALNNTKYKKSVAEFRKKFKLLVEFLLYTGLRRGEALKLTMTDVDLVRGVIFIERTKTHLGRLVPLNPRAREIIEMTRPDLFTKMHYQVVSEKFSHYLKQAGLEGFKLHSLRHTFATRLVALGVDLYTISRLLGHTDIKTTMVYAKTNIDSMQAAVNQLGKHLLQNGDAPPENGKGQ